MRVLIVGCGYVGIPLGAELSKRGHEVFGLRRSRGEEREMSDAGIHSLSADITQPAELAKLPTGYEWVVNSIASSGGGAEAYRQVYLEGTRNLLNWLAASPPKKFVYASSTSVYGQNDGLVVDESAPTEPEAATAKILVETEQLLGAVHLEKLFPAVILRVAGIYGPGRGYWLKQFLSGEARLQGCGEKFINMIHRDDLVGVIIASLEHGHAGEVYNAVDDEPVTQIALFQWLASRLGRPLLAAAPETGSEARKRRTTNKRVSNEKLRLQLGYEFKYPSFREGYIAAIESLDRRV